MGRVQYDFYIFKIESDSKRHNIFPEYDFAGYYKDLDKQMLTNPSRSVDFRKLYWNKS